jgi:hopene-associated glycosyltransferase HpnB
METFLLLSALISSLIWLVTALSPSRPWSTREVLEAEDLPSGEDNLQDITVLIPARNEAEVIPRTLPSIAAQGPDLRILLVDDGSTDETVRRAGEAAGRQLRILPGEPLPHGWGGKLWALEQGRKQITTPLTLLLDADIALSPGTAAALRGRMRRKGVSLISLMAAPSLQGFWERLLMPAFVYFFKILYPFRLANSPASKTAAAAGGCILMETGLFEEIGGFESLRDALIDDCELARRVKRTGRSTWIGLSHSVRSVRPYKGLAEIWNMVARTAFTQLRYSVALLFLCSLAMVLAFGVPPAALALGLALGSIPASFLSVAIWLTMAATYRPTLRFYGRSWAWALCLPFIATLYLAMTWTSALRYWMGERSRWKERVYDTDMAFKGAPDR